LHEPARRLDCEAGFTIVEAMVAMVILIVAVLGTLTMLTGGLASTQRTTARVQATNLARDLVERSRQVAYTGMTMSAAPATLRAALPVTDVTSAVTGTSFKVRRRNVDYNVNVFACSIDDPTDGAGVGDATFCAPPAPTSPTGPVAEPTPTAAAAINVLGVQVGLGGSLVDTVCAALGNPELLSQLTSVVSVAAPVTVCPSGTGGSVHYDSHPDDLRRVRIDVTWNSGRPESITQTTLLTSAAM
jgi:type II secretory pathway pseudopilin PulG